MAIRSKIFDNEPYVNLADLIVTLFLSECESNRFNVTKYLIKFREETLAAACKQRRELPR